MSKFKMLSRKSKSIDFSDLLITTNTSPPIHGRKSTTGIEIDTIHEHHVAPNPMIANTSLTPAEKRSDGMRSRMKWSAFSIRRSSSSSVYDQDKYCRIHDHCIAVLLEDDEEATQEDDSDISTKKTTSMEIKEDKHGKILRACKRLLRFHLH